jgi:hypothetical protein
MLFRASVVLFFLATAAVGQNPAVTLNIDAREKHDFGFRR